jgi:perosamine synthetase
MVRPSDDNRGSGLAVSTATMAAKEKELTMTRLPITFPYFDKDEIANLQACLDSKWVTQGPFTRQFEQRFAERHQVEHALATTSCTAALHLATSALGLTSGDEVIVPAFTWVTSAHCAEYVGAKVVFADVDLNTYNLDPDAFAAAITPRTRAVVVVHLFGLAARMKPVMDIASKHNIAVIEDAACAIGTTYDGKPIGWMGDLGCFSFHPRKVITTGEGGMVTTNNVLLANKVASLRNHGAAIIPGSYVAGGKPYAMGQFNVLGYNLRLSDIQASVGVAQLAKLDVLLQQRQVCARRYRDLLAGINELVLPSVPEHCGHTYQSFVVRIRRGPRTRNQIMDHLDSCGIQTRPGTHAVHRLGYYVQKYGLKPEQFPSACLAEDTTITLPLFPNMTEQDQKHVANSLKQGIVQKSLAA